MKYYYLGSCSTCNRITKEIGISQRIADMREIKSSPVTGEELDTMRKLSGSYESLFNKRARKFNQKAMKEQELSEDDYRNMILEEYTFLKRPILIDSNEIFVGNSKKTVMDAARHIADTE